MTAEARGCGLYSAQSDKLRGEKTNLYKWAAVSAYLSAHVVCGGAVEVVVGPLSELILTKLARGAVIIERELGVRFEEL